jgi:hypothetical protein
MGHIATGKDIINMLLYLSVSDSFRLKIMGIKSMDFDDFGSRLK